MPLSSLPIALGIVAIGLAVAGPTLAHLEWTSPMAGLIVFVLGGAVGLLTVIVGGLSFGVKGRVRGLVGACLGFVPAVMVCVPWLITADHPRINDISTDLLDPPTFRSAITAANTDTGASAYPPRFVPIVQASYPDVVSLKLSLAPGAALELVVAEIVRSGWQLTRRDDAAGECEAVVTTQLFHFRDDVVIRVRSVEGEPNAALIDMRSRSRLGTGDFGKNAQRIRQFFTSLRGRPAP